MLRIFLVTGLLCGLLAGNVALAMQGVGSVSELKGEVLATTVTGEVRTLAVGDELAVGEKISTADDAWVVMKFKDRSRFELGADAEMTVESFRSGEAEDGAEAEEASFVSSITRGVFRFVSGLIAKRGSNAMRVKGAVATIGIRGTQVVGEFDSTTATVILMEPEGEPHPTAIDVSNQYGSVTIDEPGYGTEVPDEFSPPSPPKRMRLQVIRNLTRSIRTMQRISVPRPRIGH